MLNHPGERYSLSRFGASFVGGVTDEAGGAGGGNAGGVSSRPTSRNPRLNSWIPLPIDDPISGIRLAPKMRVRTPSRIKMCQMLKSANTIALQRRKGLRKYNPTAPTPAYPRL